MTFRKIPALVMITLLTLAVFVVPVFAAEDAAIDPRAEQILKATADYLKEAGQCVFHAEVILDDNLPSGLMVEHSGCATCSAATFRIRVTGMTERPLPC